ncbi:transcriptional regulator [Clostridia bacterium]|nr:transcriptional regulator [Clostridia bacterium]
MYRMETKIQEIAQRIKELRLILEISEEEMARVTDMTLAEYRQYETGAEDFSFTFLYECARTFGVDIVELLTGENPKLSFYSVVRSGKGLPIRRRQSFTYQHLAYRIKDKLAEPFLVTAPYNENEQNAPIHRSHHDGQEFDIVLKGSLRVDVEGHIETLEEGDAIYYDSSHGHGMIAVGGEECTFLAVVIGDPNFGK